MKQPTAKPASQQPWCPGHWLTRSGYGLDPTDLRAGANAETDSRGQVVALVTVDIAIRKMMRP